MSYDRTKEVVASDFAINELRKAVESGKEKEFNLEQALKGWAQDSANGIPKEEIDAFVKNARKLFEIEVVVLGLREREGAPQDDEARRAQRMTYSPVYRLYHALEPLDDEEEY